MRQLIEKCQFLSLFIAVDWFGSGDETVETLEALLVEPRFHASTQTMPRATSSGLRPGP